ncbi:SWIM zinc finger family protein [bacterium]|nr:SWIM zinc finger family protein [bacterium]
MRDDLRHLTPEALAALSNWGLVKRAQKDIGAGQGPVVSALNQSMLLARFPDGVECRLPADQPWTAAHCSCGAASCRHRVALVLALPRCEAPAEADALHLDLEDLHRCLGPRLLGQARRLRSQGMQAELMGPPWQVRLPTNTVRFLSGGDLNYARCDCELAWPCEHLALAAWVVEDLAGTVGRVDWTRAVAEIDLDLDEVWQEGCLGALPKTPSGCTWIQLLLEEMAELRQAYQDGSAHYDSSRWLFCALSLWCRTHARQEVSSEYRLGRDQPLEQELEQIRLVSLGATRGHKGTNLYFCDPSGVVMRLDIPPEKSPGSGLRMPDLAYGQLVSRGVVRRANRTFRLRRERQRHSLSPLGNAWESLPPSLLWPGWEAWKQRKISQVTRLLRPRLECEDFVVMELQDVTAIAYLPGPQKLMAHVIDAHGTFVTLERTHRAQAPHALDVLAQHLPETRWVSGRIECSSGCPVLEPVAFWGEGGLRIPDLEEASPEWDLPWIVGTPCESPLQQILGDTLDLCAETLHSGRSQLLPSFDGRRAQLAERLDEAGLTRMADLLRGPWSQQDFWACALRGYLGLESLAYLT